MPRRKGSGSDGDGGEWRLLEEVLTQRHDQPWLGCSPVVYHGAHS